MRRAILCFCAFGVAAIVGDLPATSVAKMADDASRASALRRAIDGRRARNVILFLGDGMGDSEITIARNYAKGAAGRLSMDDLPFTGEYTTYAVQRGTRDVPDYVTDSAASGTGWATGHKTYNNADLRRPGDVRRRADHSGAGAAGRASRPATSPPPS